MENNQEFTLTSKKEFKMGYSTTKISVMILDDSPIQVLSATHKKYLGLKTMNDFASFRGGFEETDKAKIGTMFFVFSNPEHKLVPDFIEFIVL
jgi:hypothetical protein